MLSVIIISKTGLFLTVMLPVNCSFFIMRTFLIYAQ